MKTMQFGLPLAVAALATLGGCGGINNYLADKSETVEMYHIFDIRTAADIDTVVKGATDGLGQNSNRVQQSRPLMMSIDIPSKPGRFQLVDVGSAFNGTSMGMMMQMASQQSGGATMRTAKCDGAVWTSHATRTITGYSDLNLYNCLYAYKGGYQLDIYAVFRKTSGGVFGFTKDIADAMVGSPDVWVNKTIVDTVRSIQSATHGQVTHLEGQPKIGDLPWADRFSSR